jgi:Caspase domain
MRRFLVLALILPISLAAALAAGAESPSSPAPTRRFALVVGANSGGAGSVRLRYAVSDARSFAALLTELGGVRGEDLILLLDPSLAAFRGAAERLRASAALAEASGRRCELMLYYSGHSDEEGLLLGKEKLGYSDLRSAIEKVPAAVRVAILDSCSSGSLTRAKGGSSRPAFLFDASSDMEGHAYITSSSEAEAAQESDRIGGSFFTHYLVSALRGAADVHGEGVVTLNEAYAFAFRETLASTENTQFGPQHPAYEISLTGSGDLVFTDLRSSRAGLAFSEGLRGSIYVRDAKGALAVELDKAEGDRMEIGLPPGKYAVAMIEGAAHSQADVVVPADGKAFLAPGDFRPTTGERAAARGIAVSGAGPGAETVPSGNALVTGLPLSFDARPAPDLSRGIFSSEEDKVVSFSALWGQARDVKVQFATLMNADSGDLKGFQFAGLANAVKGRAGGVQFAPIADLALGGFDGAQLFGLLNYAEGQSLGAQVGLVNVASEITGVQVGLVNVSRRITGVPIGLVNLEEGGVLMPQAWTESFSRYRLGFAFGTRIVYTLLVAGVDAGGSGFERPQVGGGMGGRIRIGPFFGDMDLSWREIFGIAGLPPSARLGMRALAGFPGGDRAGLILGMALEGLMPGLSREDAGASVSTFRAEPRFLVGLKL